MYGSRDPPRHSLYFIPRTRGWNFSSLRSTFFRLTCCDRCLRKLWFSKTTLLRCTTTVYSSVGGRRVYRSSCTKMGVLSHLLKLSVDQVTWYFLSLLYLSWLYSILIKINLYDTDLYLYLNLYIGSLELSDLWPILNRSTDLCLFLCVQLSKRDTIDIGQRHLSFFLG